EPTTANRIACHAGVVPTRAESSPNFRLLKFTSYSGYHLHVHGRGERRRDYLPLSRGFTNRISHSFQYRPCLVFNQSDLIFGQPIAPSRNRTTANKSALYWTIRSGRSIGKLRGFLLFFLHLLYGVVGDRFGNDSPVDIDPQEIEYTNHGVFGVPPHFLELDQEKVRRTSEFRVNPVRHMFVPGGERIHLATHEL